jgi:hypothetical protein
MSLGLLYAEFTSLRNPGNRWLSLVRGPHFGLCRCPRVVVNLADF